MIEDDSAYFSKRAEAERERALHAAQPEVALVHQQLAEAYLDRLKSDARPDIDQAT